jgi:hypothetical protein
MSQRRLRLWDVQKEVLKHIVQEQYKHYIKHSLQRESNHDKIR